MPEGFEFNASVKFENDTLFLTYTVVNSSDNDLYLLNRLYQSTPAWDFGPHLIYVELDDENKVIRLSKKLANLPDGQLITAPVAPFVTPVRAGDTFEEEVKLVAPITECLQYESRESDEETGPVEFDQIEFELGYYWRANGGTEEDTVIEGEKLILPQSPPGAQVRIESIQMNSARLAVPVLLPIIESQST